MFMYEIRNEEGKVVESHETLDRATKAFWILTAHELKNERKAAYTLDTRSCDGVQDFSKFDLPRWAKEVLKEHVG